MNDKNGAIISQNDTAPKHKDPNAGEAPCAACVSCLTHRNGTDGKNLYLVSAVDGAVKATNTSSGSLTGIPVNRSMADAFRENDRCTLFSVHNHPSNAPRRART